MEGVGAVPNPIQMFTGPVRKWMKKWVHVSPSSASSNTNTNHNHASHLLLYKWTPLTQSHNTNHNSSNTNGNAKDAPPKPPQEQPRRKFKYILDDIHQSIKNNVWENTLNDNKKLDAAYQEAKEKPGCSLIFCYFQSMS